MTSYTTCINCAADKQACERRNAVRAAIKGAHITSVKFRCTDRQSMFHPGQRVGITWTAGNGDYELDETWPGTVIRESGTRFLIAIDDVPSDEGTPARSYIRNERLFVKVSPSRLQLLDEPDRRICKFCERAPATGDACIDRDTDIWSFNSGFPLGCMLKEAADA
ncbi:MAG: hypothetical protein K2Q27_14970 [Novosphingobium sp.]|uniref:hypothetical protein n=1 Tax=Novosphingobium sp. NDB2Meth1 TaxID=1892847 RepID=UPI0009311992|nr:hypothetical protein [Novosphingobium sp. NDB2Meth1]MBY0394555.1 hypothetical protein [Novosphingobium sp.]